MSPEKKFVGQLGVVGLATGFDTGELIWKLPQYWSLA